jgi:putative PIN family toxin of toxin-antitoxin system
METQGEGVGAAASKPVAAFDCMVFLQGAARPRGPAAACLRLAEEGRIRLLISGDVLKEIADVFSRSGVRQRFPVLAEIPLTHRLARWQSVATFVSEIPPTVHLSRDPKDEKYLNLAVAGRADYLVSWDKHLIGLRSDDTPEALHFREAHPDIRIVTPVEFLQAISASVR